jgi:hypothetical protein
MNTFRPTGLYIPLVIGAPAPRWWDDEKEARERQHAANMRAAEELLRQTQQHPPHAKKRASTPTWRRQPTGYPPKARLDTAEIYRRWNTPTFEKGAAQ